MTVVQRMSERKAERQDHKAHNFRFANIRVQDDEIIHGRKHYPLAGAHATVNASGDHRQVFVTVEGVGFGFVKPLPARLSEGHARKFAVKLNAIA